VEPYGGDDGLGAAPLFRVTHSWASFANNRTVLATIAAEPVVNGFYSFVYHEAHSRICEF
jgi:hypothetical protein